MCDIGVVNEVVAAGWSVEAAEHVHEGGLAGARRAHDGEILASGDGKGDAIECVHGRGGIVFLVNLVNVFDDGNVFWQGRPFF